MSGSAIEKLRVLKLINSIRLITIGMYISQFKWAQAIANYKDTVVFFDQVSFFNQNIT